jgi:hypothetical protein
MEYYIVEPVADAELGEQAVISFAETPREIINAHVYLFGYPESDLVQAYPLFLATSRLRAAIENSNIRGAIFLPCKVSKSDQYDELSHTTSIPEMFCLEPMGADGVDDLVYHTETELKASRRFVDLLHSMSHNGCIFTEE